MLGVAAPSAGGAPPSWQLVLDYEMRVRTEAFKAVQLDRVTLAHALKELIDLKRESSRTLRLTHFLEPLLLQRHKSGGGSKRKEAADEPEGPPAKRVKPDPPKGASKGDRKATKTGAPVKPLDVFNWADGQGLLKHWQQHRGDGKAPHRQQAGQVLPHR